MDLNPPDMTGGEGAVPQVPPLEALATALPQEAFTAIQTAIHNLDQRISAAQSSIMTSQNLQNIIQSAFSNAHFTINAGALPTQAPAYFNPPEIKLTPFYGKDTENIRIWIGVTEDALHASELPRDKWSCYVALMLRDAALLWYYAKRMANNERAPHWDDLRQAMLNYWDDPARIDELRLCLDRITYRGSISDYVRLFQGVEIQIPADAMSLDVRKHKFLGNLPAELVVELDQQSQSASDMESVYLAARRWESFCRVARGVDHFYPGSSKNRRSRRDAPAPSISQNYHDADAPTPAPTTAPPGPTTVRRDSRPRGQRPPRL